MRIVMLDSISMANGVLKGGTIYDMSEERAQKLISRGQAKAIDVEPEKTLVKRRVTSLPHGDKG